MSLASHLQAFRCKEAEWQASQEDLQGQLKKISEDNERLISKVDRLRRENEKLMSSHRSSKSGQFSLGKTFMPGVTSPMHSARGERKNSAAITKLATFRASQYTSTMGDRSNSQNQLMMSSMTMPKKVQNVFAEKTNTSIIQVAQSFKQPKTKKENDRYGQSQVDSAVHKSVNVSHRSRKRIVFD